MKNKVYCATVVLNDNAQFRAFFAGPTPRHNLTNALKWVRKFAQKGSAAQITQDGQQVWKSGHTVKGSLEECIGGEWFMVVNIFDNTKPQDNPKQIMKTFKNKTDGLANLTAFPLTDAPKIKAHGKFVYHDGDWKD